MSVPIRDAGTYHVIFDNGFSVFSTKQVRVELRLVYDGEDRELAAQLAKAEDERVKQLSDILGKLTETLQARERRLGTQQIKPPIRFGIIENKSLNAFAVPDQNIVAVNRGLVNFAEAVGVPEITTSILAGVLGHELAHVFYRHSSGNVQAQGAQAAGLGLGAAYLINPFVGLLAGAIAMDSHRAYDRMEEREADMLGIQLACEAGYDPTGLLVFMQRLSKESSGIEFLSTHPAPQNREEYLQSAAISCLRPQAAPVQTTSNVVRPEPLLQPKPAYTPEARVAGIRGTVIVEFTIGVDGRAHDLKVLQSLGYGLDESAVQTIETLWRFKPGQRDGQPVPVSLKAEITFQP